MYYSVIKFTQQYLFFWLIVKNNILQQVRVVTATKLHEALMTNDELVAEEEMDTLCDILNETEWYASLLQVFVLQRSITFLLSFTKYESDPE